MKKRAELLEVTSPELIRSTRKQVDARLRFHWNFFFELAHQRKRIETALQEALIRHARRFEFSRWQRGVKYRYSLHPFSALGSMMAPNGRRFNFGALDPSLFPPFPALYVGTDKNTVLQEMLGGIQGKDGLTPHELALVAPDSVSLVSVSGLIDATLDVRNGDALGDFVDLIKGFRVSESLRKEARRLEKSIRLVQTAADLFDSLTDPNWQFSPAACDVPAASQVFGQLAANAGVGALLYRSKYTLADCLAIFTRNLKDSSSFVSLDDVPPDTRVIARVDETNWFVCERERPEMETQDR